MFKKEPVLILLNGLAVVANLVLVMLTLLNVISLDGTQTAAIVATVQGVTALISAVVRGEVYSPASYEAAVTDAFSDSGPVK